MHRCAETISARAFITSKHAQGRYFGLRFPGADGTRPDDFFNWCCVKSFIRLNLTFFIDNRTLKNFYVIFWKVFMKMLTVSLSKLNRKHLIFLTTWRTHKNLQKPGKDTSNETTAKSLVHFFHSSSRSCFYNLFTEKFVFICRFICRTTEELIGLW